MNFSHRITNINRGGSDGWEVFYRSREMIGDGIKITELTTGEHDIGTDPMILEAMAASTASGHTGYPSIPGIAALRDKVAARIQARTGVATARENVLITPGGQAALFATHCSVCDPGDAALYLDPYYATYPGTIRSIGASDHPVPTHASNRFQPRFEDIDAVASALPGGAKSLLINTPNNPTGVVYTREALESIAKACKKHNLWLISDEVYDTQVWEGEHISPRSLPGMLDRTLVIGSMSKSHAMTGSRIGWVVGPAPLIKHLINLATNTTYGVPGYIQDAALFALNQGAGLEDKVAAPFERRRALAQSLVAVQNTVSMVPSGGAMYVMLDIRATGLSGLDFANALLDAKHIATMPGESFGASAAGHIRIAMTVEDKAFSEAFKTILTFAQERAK